MALLPPRKKENETKISSADVDMHSDQSRNIGVEVEDLIVVTDDTMNSVQMKEYARDIEFMEEELTVVVGETSNPNDERLVTCGVNGEKRVLTRGVEYKLKRKFIDSLLRVEETVATENYKDKEGLDQTRIVKRRTPKYQINVRHDPSGAVGSRWFDHQLRNG